MHDEWLSTSVVALVFLGLTLAAVGLIAYIRLIDPFRLDAALWIGDLTQGVIVLVATLALLALAFASGEAYAYVAAASSASVEAAGIWLLWLISRFRGAPAGTTPLAGHRRLRTEMSDEVQAPGMAGPWGRQRSASPH